MRSIEPMFSHLSGSTALDVINTVDWRLDPTQAVELLGDLDTVLAWCRESGFLDNDEEARLTTRADRHPRNAKAALEDFQSVRDHAYAALVEHDQDAINAFAIRQQQAFGAAGLHPDGNGWVWLDTKLDLRTPADRLTRALAELMRSEDITRLSQCADDACGWVYLDTSPRKNRRWCAASDCGDRNRARAYYRRRNKASR